MADTTRRGSGKTYVVEHLDPEMGPWSTLEYKCIAEESRLAGAKFCLSSVPEPRQVPEQLKDLPGLEITNQSVEVLYGHQKDRVCLLDPAAAEELSPQDASSFDVFLFGGILGDDPPRDRTSQLRVKGFPGRRLGPKQMTTDTAVRVTRMVIEDQVPLDKISYIDFPELKLDEHESTEMPFRYVQGSDNKPIMPKGMFELIKQDSEKSIDDLF